MKNTILTLCLSIVCLAASAQPTSFGGIKPGKTTREELKNMVKDPNRVDSNEDNVTLTLLQPDGMRVTVYFYDGIVYKLSSSNSDLSPELKQALIEKYGQPRIKVGGIGTEECQNGFGATFVRPRGKENLKWPIKDGVQGEILSAAFGCVDVTVQYYQLIHVATAKIVDSAKLEANLEKEQKAKAERQKKFGDY